MHAAYIAITGGAAAANACAAVLNFIHHRSVVRTATKLGVPPSWMVPMGCLLAAGSVGLVVGFGVPALGTAAAGGLVLYFACAAAAHRRARDTALSSWLNWAVFFALAMAALVVAIWVR